MGPVKPYPVTPPSVSTRTNTISRIIGSCSKGTFTGTRWEVASTRIIFISLSPELAFKSRRGVFQTCQRGGTPRMGPWTLHIGASTRLVSVNGRPKLSPGELTGQVATAPVHEVGG